MRLLDEHVPRYDLFAREHRVLAVPPERVWPSLRPLLEDPPSVLEETGFPVRVRAGVANFDEVLSTACWVRLGRDEREVVLGAAGRFWTPFMDWQRLSADEFVTFSRPRRATIAVAVSVRPYTGGRTLLSFEARVRATDAIAFRWADWYWHAIRPSARLTIQDLLRALERTAINDSSGV